jgi:hypothetical protein
MKKLLIYIDNNISSKFGDYANELTFNRGYSHGHFLVKLLWKIDNTSNELRTKYLKK